MSDAGQRRPEPADLEPLLELIWDGKSLRAACATLGLHTPSTSTWIHADNGRREQYVRACEGRAEFLQEEGLTINKAAALSQLVQGKKVDASGARGYLDAIKWATARMAPKTAPVTRIDVTSRTREMTDAEIAAEIEALEGGTGGEPT
jgi:hypothetical protein